MTDYLTGLVGYSLYRIAIDVKTSPKSKLEHSRQFLSDPGTRQEVITHTTNLPIKYNVAFTNLERSEIYELINFFNTVRGRRTPFWWIFQQTLFTPALDYLATDTVLAVEANKVIYDFRGYERIFIYLTSRDLLTFQVSNITPGLNETDPYSLTISTAIGRIVEKQDILMFGKLLFCRLDSDELKVNYQTATCASSTIDLIELTEEYPD